MSTITTERIETKNWLQFVTRFKHRRSLMNLLMLLADLLGFAVAVALTLVLNGLWEFFIFSIEDLKYLVILLFCLLLFLNSKLYPGVGINPAEEIKLVTKYVTTAFVCGWFVTIWIQTRPINHFAFPILWGFSVFSILLLRWCVRISATKLGLWGEPVVIIGRDQHVNRTITYFMERKRLGYIPVLAAIDSVENQPQTGLVPTIKYSTLLDSNAVDTVNSEIQIALVDVPAISEFLRSDTCKAIFHRFRRVILVSDLDWIDGASMQIQDFEGMIGIAVEKGVLTPTAVFLKRMLDISVALIVGIMLLPVMLVVAIWIKLDSAGPVFYVQERFGKDRRRIARPGNHWRKVRIYKFRSMFNNADGILETYLHTHPEASSEWELNHKLPNDPRITRAGRLLRKFSIDELPQLLNVLKGEMSLVGPRPLPDYHYNMLSENLKTLRAKLRPGLTGMWQVSGRSDCGTSGMEMWDSYYIHNWSLWLDIYIIMRTVWVVLKKDGAY